MRKQLILELQQLINSNHEKFKRNFFILSNSSEKVRHQVFLSAILSEDNDTAIYEYLKNYTVKNIKRGLAHSSIEKNLKSNIVSKLSEIKKTTSFEALANMIISEEPVGNLTEVTAEYSQASDLTNHVGDGMTTESGFINPSTSKTGKHEESALVAADVKEDGFINVSTSNTVDLGDVVVAEQASPLVSSNSFFKVMTSDTAKLVAASISLFAGAALTAFLCVTGMASIALAALAAALIIMSAACIAILMKNKTSAPVCAM